MGGNPTSKAKMTLTLSRQAISYLAESRSQLMEGADPQELNVRHRN
jgi:hypothetical protein